MKHYILPLLLLTACSVEWTGDEAIQARTEPVRLHAMSMRCNPDMVITVSLTGLMTPQAIGSNLPGIPDSLIFDIIIARRNCVDCSDCWCDEPLHGGAACAWIVPGQDSHLWFRDVALPVKEQGFVYRGQFVAVTPHERAIITLPYALCEAWEQGCIHATVWFRPKYHGALAVPQAVWIREGFGWPPEVEPDVETVHRITGTAQIE